MVLVTSFSDRAICYAAAFFTRRGLSQSSRLHFGQTFGACVLRGIHSCSQREHLYIVIVIVLFTDRILYLIRSRCQHKSTGIGDLFSGGDFNGPLEFRLCRMGINARSGFT